MNQTNELNHIIIETIKDVKGGVGKSVDFLLEQAPDVAQQLLTISFIENIVYTIGWGACVAVLLYCARLVLRYNTDGDDDFLPPAVIKGIGLLVLGMCLFGCWCATVNHAATAAKIKVAPKVFLIEYCSKLLK